MNEYSYKSLKNPPRLRPVGLSNRAIRRRYTRIDVSRLRIPHLVRVKNNVDTNLNYKAMFDGYFKRWRERMGVSSSVGAIVEDENFQSIVLMGEKATPFIIQKIKEGPTLLVWALNLIYGKEVCDDPNVPLDEVGKLWIRELSA